MVDIAWFFAKLLNCLDLFFVLFFIFMTNRSSSKYHGMNSVNQTRPKSLLRKRRNKAKASLLRQERRA